MSFSITVHSTWQFRRISTSRNTSVKLGDKLVGSRVSLYSSTPLQSIKGMLYSYYVPHVRMDAYKASIFYGLVASPPPVGIFLCIFPPLISLPVCVHRHALLHHLYGVLSAYQFWNGIWRWDITLLFSSTILSILSLSSVLFLSLGLRLTMKQVVPLMLWVRPWIFEGK